MARALSAHPARFLRLRGGARRPARQPLWLLAAGLSLLAPPAWAAEPDPPATARGPAVAAAAPDAAGGGESAYGTLQWRRLERRASTLGPLAQAEALQPGLIDGPRPGWAARTDLRRTWHARAAGLPLALGLQALAEADRDEGRATQSRLRLQEAHVAADAGAWQFSAGRKVVSWDVGHGFRPNDVVQQEQRRALLSDPLRGVALLQAERFEAEQAWALLWANPHHRDRDALASRGAEEEALAARAYWRRGALDAHGFARLGERTGASVGAAAAWVAGDSVSVHGSWRTMQHHEGWQFDPGAGERPVAADPYAWRRGGRASQALLGLQWTGEAQQGVLVEAWVDHTAPTAAQWQQWRQRNGALGALQGLGVPAGALAGNLAWQARALDRPTLRRRNLFLRLSWTASPWDFAFDTLYTPEDGGRVHSLSAAWQGDRVKLTLAARRIEGPATAILRHTPVRTSALANLAWSF